MENNPYVEPRPYHRGEWQHLHGHECDARDTFSLILVEPTIPSHAADIGTADPLVPDVRTLAAADGDGHVRTLRRIP